MATNAVRLGVDFGTSNTVAVLRRDDQATPLLFDSSPLLASGVFVGSDAAVLTGADAERAATAHPAGFEANPKRRIDDGAVWLGDHEVAVTALVAAVLGRVVSEASRVAGAPPGSAVLTHPVAWSRTRLGLLASAARDSGLRDVRFMPEPVAASAYFAAVLGHDFPPERCLVVYDLGAGTFDVSVVRRPANGPGVVVATDGFADVGGLDLDAVVVEHARSVTSGAQAGWGRLDWPETPADQRAHRTLWHGARAVKEQLSRHAKADLHVPLVDADVHVTREEFERAARPHLDRTVALTLATLRAAGVRREQIAGVFLVGGSSRIPLVASLLHRALQIAPTAIDQPELVVAIGSLYAEPAAHTTLPLQPYPDDGTTVLPSPEPTPTSAQVLPQLAPVMLQPAPPAMRPMSTVDDPATEPVPTSVAAEPVAPPATTEPALPTTVAEPVPLSAVAEQLPPTVAAGLTPLPAVAPPASPTVVAQPPPPTVGAQPAPAVEPVPPPVAAGPAAAPAVADLAAPTTGRVPAGDARPVAPADTTSRPAGRTSASRPRQAVAGLGVAALLSVVQGIATVIALSGAHAGDCVGFTGGATTCFASTSAERAEVLAFAVWGLTMAAVALALVGFLPRRDAATSGQRSLFVAGIIGCVVSSLVPLLGVGLVAVVLPVVGLPVLAVVGARTGVWSRPIAVAMALLPIVWVIDGAITGKLFGLPELLILATVAVATTRARRHGPSGLVR
ncbi:Hsp70 family protein [Dactylosporangium sp. NPDC049525]|uniref:Hsp70 family protein n=1 Tax=Dactylosporangium sp. NPDC049525 TaxID=3154730 RepID=UPI003416A1DC